MQVGNRKDDWFVMIMGEKVKNLYYDAHLVAASIRLFEHQNHTPPSIEDISRMLSFSTEQGSLLCKKMKDRNIIDIIEGAFGTKLYLLNHLLIEEIKQEEPESSIASEVKKFQEFQKMNEQKFQAIRDEHKKKQQDLFAKLNDQLKKKLEK